jgi:hypothetical protein
LVLAERTHQKSRSESCPLAGAIAILYLLSTTPTFAQAGVSSQTPDSGQATNVACPGAAVFSAGSGPEVHVTGIGTLDQRNPLAPAPQARPATVLEVRIRGKLASATGPSFQELRRGGPPQDLERELGNRIVWEADLSTLPHNLLIVGEERGEVIAKLRFVKCAPSPKVPPRQQQPVRPRAKEKPAPAPQQPVGPIPQGAID